MQIEAAPACLWGRRRLGCFSMGSAAEDRYIRVSFRTRWTNSRA